MNSKGRVSLPGVLSPLQALGIIIGGTVGASIFLVPSAIARGTPYLSTVIFVWLAGALVGLSGALTMAELGAMLPEAGGGYAYIRAAFGPNMAFLFAWIDAGLIRPGAAAAIAFTFGIYFARLVPAPAGVSANVWTGGFAALLIVLLTAINLRGVSAGASVQVAGMLMKMAALSAALILPVLLWHGANGLSVATIWPPVNPATGAGVVAAMVPVMWSFAGWEQLGHLTEELRNPARELPRVLTAGLLIIALLYMAVVIGIHYVLPWGVVTASEAVGADLFRAVVGPAGAAIITGTILISAAITTNGAILAGPRVAFAAARNGLFPAWLLTVHPRFGTPSLAVLATGGWAVVLILVSVLAMETSPSTGLPEGMREAWLGLQKRPLFEVLVAWVMFAYLFLQALMPAALLVLRRKHPHWKRPFRVPGYPVLPLAGMAAMLFLMLSIAQGTPLEAAAGVGLMALGLVVRMATRDRYHE